MNSHYRQTLSLNRQLKNSKKPRDVVRSFVSYVLCLTIIVFSNGVFSQESAKSDIVVVVNANNEIDSLSKKEVIDNFMGRFSSFPNGERAETLDYPAGTQIRRDFYILLVDKDERKIKAYWSRLLFSGRASPPRVIDELDLLISEIETNENSLAFIDKKHLNDKMKVVYHVE